MTYRNIKNDELLRDYEKNEKRYGFLSVLSKDELIDRYFYQIKVYHDIINDLTDNYFLVGGICFSLGIVFATIIFLVFS